MTVNLLRQSNVTPKILAYAYGHGTQDWNDHPLAPLGCAVQVFKRVEDRGSWAQHYKNGWYIGCAHEHYRNHKVWIKDTNAEHVSDTMHFKHKHVTEIAVTAADAAVDAANKLTNALQGRLPQAIDEVQMEGLKKLSKLFTRASKLAKEMEQRVTNAPLGVASSGNAPPGVPETDNEDRCRSARLQYKSIDQECLLAILELNRTNISPKQTANASFQGKSSPNFLMQC